MPVARCAAFLAPASPMATVATGIPAGICAIERSASSPPRAPADIGTPISGGERDLPPTAPGLSRALTAPLGITLRRADHDCVADSEAVEYLAAALHSRTIRLAAHDDPDQGSVAHWGTADSISRSARSCR